MNQVCETGCIFLYAGNMNPIPEGFLQCNGSSISRNEYRNLFLVIGTTYGVGDGVNTFALPNLMNCFPIMNKMLNLGANGGNNSISLDNYTNELPSHTHGIGSLAVDDHTHSLQFPTANYISHINEANNTELGTGFYVNSNDSNNLPTTTGNSDTTFIGNVSTSNNSVDSINILNSSLVLNYIIKT
jgi:microcystin-dependent protein